MEIERTQDDVTPESIEDFFAGVQAGVDAEATANAPSEAAEALAASWQPRHADYGGVMDAADYIHSDADCGL